MSFSEITFVSPLLATVGFTLSVLNAPFVYTIARQLRAWIWMVVILFGEAAAFPLYFLSILVGLCAALPICSTVISLPSVGSSLQLSVLQSSLLMASILFRILLWPAVGLEWATVKKWEQEVVRRPRGRLLAYLQAPNHRTREILSLRATALGQQLAQNELKSSSTLGSIPTQSFGLVLLYCAALTLNPYPTVWQTNAKFLVILTSIFVILRGLNRAPEGKNEPKLSLSMLILIIILFSSAGWFIGLWPEPTRHLQRLVNDFSRFILLAAILTVGSRDLERLLESKPRAGAEVGSAPMNKKFSVLKKITQTTQWLVKPKHLVSLVMQTDILLTTLKITLSW